MTSHNKKSLCRKLIFSLILAAVPTIAMADAVTYLNQSVAPKYKLEMNEATFAQNNIDKGYGVLNKVMNGQYDYLSNQDNDATDVVAVMWALFDAGVAKGQGYEQGSFVVEDSNWYLYNFLRGNQEAASRHSSHLGRATKLTNAGHYGIDILGSYQAGASDWTPYSTLNPSYVQQNILPAKKGTILFIPMQAGQNVGLTTNQIFIKMEDHGMKTWSGWAHHAWDFVTGTCLGLGVDPNEAARKERVDKNIASLYLKVVKTLTNAQVTAHTTNAKELGVRVMVAEANRLSTVAQDNPGFTQALAAFTAAVDAKNYDNLGMRTGDEVIFTQAELQRSIDRHHGGSQLNAALADSSDWESDMGDAMEAAPELNAAQQAAVAAAPAESKGFLGTLSSWIW
jgi:hypothetical protein